jgi:hypothetical protein
MNYSTTDERSWLARLADKVPGYAGYADKDRRRQTDKLHREYLADRLRNMKATLAHVVRELTGNGRLFEVAPIDRASKKLDRLENRFRFASYGYSGFFDAAKIREAELDSLYRFDLSLVQGVDVVEGRVLGLKEQAVTPEGLSSAVAELESAMDELDHSFDGRHSAVDSFGQGQEPSEPRSIVDG